MTPFIGRLILGAYWPPRQESVLECSARMRAMFGDLVGADSRLVQWYEKAHSREKSLARPALVHSPDYWMDLMHRSQAVSDSPRKPIEDLGFSIGLWNGNDSFPVVLSASCGSYNQYVGNSVTLSFPSQPHLGRTPMRIILCAVARAWEPAWAGVMSRAAMDARPFDTHRPFVDWMLYVSPRWLAAPPPFEPPVTAQEFASGTLVIVQNEPPDPTSAGDLANIRRVEKAINVDRER